MNPDEAKERIRQKWLTMPSAIETAARAVCVADGVDPDAEGYGLGVSMPEGERYPLWHARVKQVRAVLEALAKPASGDPHRMHASYEDLCFVDTIRLILDDERAPK